MRSPYDFYTDNGLHRIFNNFGLSSLDRGINVPQPALGIGYAELTASVPLLAPYAPTLKQPEISPVVSITDTYVKTVTPPIGLDSFGQGAYYGEALGGY